MPAAEPVVNDTPAPLAAGAAEAASGAAPERGRGSAALTLVPPEVSAAKLATELADWEANATLYQRRGWLLMERGQHHVVVGFIATVPFVGMFTVPVITACVHIDYTNYDLWPPSVTFVDPRTREPAAPPVRAPHAEAGELRDTLVDNPVTGRPFLCLPGIREYHNHPQHTGDDWLLHRATGAGRLAVICEHIWQRMVRNVLGLRVAVQALPPAVGTQVEVSLAQGDAEALLKMPKADQHPLTPQPPDLPSGHPSKAPGTPAHEPTATVRQSSRETGHGTGEIEATA